MSNQQIDGNLHVNSLANPAVLKVQSAGKFGAARVEFWSDPVGSNTEWRPGFIQSTDQAGGTWTGGLAFFVNGTGFANKTAAVEVMRLTQNMVGIGTTTPQSQLHVQGGEIFSGGQMGGLSFGDRGVPGYVGSISMGADGGQRWTWHSIDRKARLWSGTDKLTVDASGNVGIGTSSPQTQLHVIGSEIFSGGKGGGLSFGDRGVPDFIGSISMGLDGGQRWTWYSEGCKARLWSGTNKMVIDTAGNVTITGNLINGCSKELKQNIASLAIQEAAQVLQKLNPVTFQYRADADQRTNIGFIAEDVPDLLATPDRKGLSAMDVVAVLTKVVQEQQEAIANLTTEMQTLKLQTQPA